MALGELNPNSYGAANALWHFNGNSTDSSGNGLNGTDTSVTYPSGKFSQCGLFNGTSSKIVLTDNAKLKPTSSFTILAWLRFTSAGGVWFSSCATPTVTQGIQGRASSGKIEFRIATSSGSKDSNNAPGPLQSKTTFNDGIWHLVTLVWDSATMIIYMDGALNNTLAWTSAPNYAATNYVRIGCENQTGSDGSFFNGSIDELSLIPKALSAAEIKNYYNWSKGAYTKIA